MLELLIKEKELFNDETEEFITIPKKELRLEHSLVSISKWESKWKKPFLKPEYVFTKEEFLDYVRCMTITQNVPSYIYEWLDESELNEIKSYINDEHTATVFNDRSEKQNKKVKKTVTSELIYYWMASYNIPIECQCWHLGRLLTLIKICSLKASGGKKMSTSEIMAQNRALNEERRRVLRSKG